MNKKTLSERDICTRYITPALEKSGWDKQLQILEEVSFTDGKIYVTGKITARGIRKRADSILYYKPNILIAIIEAKDNNHSVRTGIQQGLDYAQILDISYVFSSNGDGFLYHDCTVDTIKKWWNNRKESKVEEVVYDRKAIIENLEKSFQESLQILNELNNG
jgi:type I restriction enzyme R subunit